MRKVLIFFAELTDEDTDWLVAVGRQQTFPAGSVLVHEGQPLDALFLVLDGKLTVSAGRPKPKPLSVLGAGEIVGELSYIDSRPPSATVTATEPTLVLRISRTTLSEKLKSDVSFASRFYRALAVMLAQRLRSNVAQLAFGDSTSLEEDEESADEIDPVLLDNLALAAARFDWMLERLKAK